MSDAAEGSYEQQCQHNPLLAKLDELERAGHFYPPRYSRDSYSPIFFRELDELLSNKPPTRYASVINYYFNHVQQGWYDVIEIDTVMKELTDAARRQYGKA